jgi:hypothetical protein
MGFRFQKRISILPGIRANLSKSGVSASLGPRGADVNIGRDGVTTNAGIPGTGLSYRQKIGGGSKGGIVGVLTVLGGLGFWAFQHQSKVEKAIATVIPATTQQVAAPASAVAPAAPAGLRYVHREGSVLREEARVSGKTLKKESKGAQVTLLSESDGWAKVTDGNITGYMRASVLGTAPPE